MDAITKQALRIVHLFGNDDVHKINTTVGAEQEYFLIDKEYYSQRRDLKYTGRTLFGAMCPKGQEMEDHYFGTIQPRVKAFMDELNVELWKLGIMVIHCNFRCVVHKQKQTISKLTRRIQNFQIL